MKVPRAILLGAVGVDLDDPSIKLKKGVNRKILLEAKRGRQLAPAPFLERTIWWTLFDGKTPVAIGGFFTGFGGRGKGVPSRELFVSKKFRGEGYGKALGILLGRMALKRYGGFFSRIAKSNLRSIRNALAVATVLKLENKAKVKLIEDPFLMVEVTK